jgi:multicomponent Na+:H+ antiporter subunit D
MYFQEPPPGAPEGEAPLPVLLATWLLLGASLFFGVFTDGSAGVAERAAGQLLGVSP